MSAKKKKQSNSPLRVIIILVLLGLLAYKHQLFDGKLLENIPTIESNEEKPEILTSPQHGGALEIPMIQSSTGGQILKRKGYTLSYINPEKPDVPLNKNDAFQKVQKRRVQEKR